MAQGTFENKDVVSSSSKVLLPPVVSAFGKEPTNRVLPVDHLTDADYEDINEPEITITKGYCARLLLADVQRVKYILLLCIIVIFL